MTDIWSFLLQTLTASGVAVLLILIKALFKDKLPPKWHFTVWGVLGIIILFPAGLFGRYTLVNWQVPIEVLKGIAGEYGFSKVKFPVPVVTSMPETVAEWIFALYVIGVVISLLWYAVSYVGLRMVLAGGRPATGRITERVSRIAAEVKVKPCRTVAVRGLPGAFVCGVFRPVLAVPADGEVDDKVLLHELLHLKYRDTLWSTLICILRCIHWCNPLIVYCAGRAVNDMESRCDQLVLERLEGEDRREYGRILLSMVNERFAKTPGTTCLSNGGKNIKERIEAIARFKKYPVGMGLVSKCVLAVLTLSLVVGVQASYREYDAEEWLSVASARSTYCTTPDGAFDTYAKAVLTQNGFYRLMCAPVSEQKTVTEEVRGNEKKGIFPNWNSGLDEMPYASEGYYVYNLKETREDVYEGLLVLRVAYIPDVIPEMHTYYLAVQNIRAEREGDRWVTFPLDDFSVVETHNEYYEWGCDELPGVRYTGIAGDFEINVTLQTNCTMESAKQDESDIISLLSGPVYYDTLPRPDAEFTKGVVRPTCGVVHAGNEEERKLIETIGISLAADYQEDDVPAEPESIEKTGISYSANGSRIRCTTKTEPGWGPYIEFIRGGYGTNLPKRDMILPERYVADLYVNGELVGRVDLYPEGGDAE
ncbi:MAG: M56 family metallopeptidase [Clostridia bacterium]|nr:M56 family metallopeptidase [Clostridia bacterium]